MEKRQRKQSLLKALALVLALVLTLGNLPLMSFAEGAGQESQYNNEYKAYFFFATADYDTDPNGRLNYYHQPVYWFPKADDKKVVGRIYSNTLDFNTGLDNYTHAVYIPQANSDSYSELFQKKQAFSDDIVLKLGNVEFNPNNEDSMNRDEVRAAFKTAFEKNGVTTFKITDSNKKEIDFTPENFMNPEYKLRVMRYKKNDTSEKRIHVDMYIERGAAQPITLIEYIDGEKQSETTTENPKFGDTLELGKENHTIEKVTISVDGEDPVTLTPQEASSVENQLKANPIKHDGKKKKVEVWYKSKNGAMSGGIEVKPAIVEGQGFDKLSSEEQKKFTDLIKFIEDGTEVTKLTADPKAVGSEEKIKITAPKGLWVQKVWIGDVETGAVEHGENEVYTVSHKTEKQVLYVYYNKKKPEFEIIALLPDGTEEKLNGKFQGVYGDDYYIPMDNVPEEIAGNYDYAAYTLNSKGGDKTESTIIPGTNVNEDLKTVYLHYEAKPQPIQYDIKFISKKMDESGPYSEQSMKYTPNSAEDLTGIKTLFNNLKNPPKYYNYEGAYIGDEKIEIANLKHNDIKGNTDIELRFVRKDSKVTVKEYVDGKLNTTKTENAKQGKDYTITFNSSYNKDSVKLDNAAFNETKFMLTKDEHILEIYYKTKPSGGNPGDNNNNNNGGNGGIGGPGNENNNGGNNGGSTGGNDGGYQQYNPGNNNGGNNAGTNNGGNDNGGNDNGSNNKPNTDGGSNNGNNTGRDNVEINDDDVALGNLNYDDFYAYIQGYPDGSVRSSAYVNREETAAIFFRLLEPKYRDSIRSEVNNFSDISKMNWSNKHISTLAKGGILNGYETGDFRPFDAITRGELAAIAAKFDKLEGSVAHSFTDIKGHWAEKYVANASAKGWIKGYPNGEFRPDKPITRAEFVTFINKVLNRNVKKAEILPGIRQFTDLTKDAWYYEDMVTATNSYLAKRGDDGYQKWTELIKPQIEM